MIIHISDTSKDFRLDFLNYEQVLLLLQKTMLCIDSKNNRG